MTTTLASSLFEGLLAGLKIVFLLSRLDSAEGLLGSSSEVGESDESSSEPFELISELSGTGVFFVQRLGWSFFGESSAKSSE